MRRQPPLTPPASGGNQSIRPSLTGAASAGELNIPPFTGGQEEGSLPSWDYLPKEAMGTCARDEKSTDRREKRLWSRIRDEQLGVKFRRQHPLGPSSPTSIARSITLPSRLMAIRMPIRIGSVR